MIQVARRDYDIFHHEGKYYLGEEIMGTVHLYAELQTNEIDRIVLFRRGSDFYPGKFYLNNNLFIEFGHSSEDDNYLVSYVPGIDGGPELVNYRIQMDWKQIKPMIAQYNRQNSSDGSTSTLY